MKYGFIKCGAATPKITVGDCLGNAKAIVNLIKQADGKGVKLLALPELCISGYTCSDLFLQDALLDGVERAIEYILVKSKSFDTVAAIGAPLRYNGKLYNCAVVIYKGEILGVVPKTNVPNYGEFYEARHFSAYDKEEGEITLAGKKVAFGQAVFVNESLQDYAFSVELCEDLWVADSPSIALCESGARIVLNLSASDEVVGKSEYRTSLVAAQSGKLCCGYVYASAGDGESTTDMVFAGHNIIAENGNILAQSKLFSNGLLISDLDVSKLSYERRKTNTYRTSNKIKKITFNQKLSENVLTRAFSPTPFVPQDEDKRDDRCELILTMQAQGMKKRIEHTGSKKLVVGLSGGLDSALALLVVCKAIDSCERSRKDVLAVTMPCFGTTKRTKSNAEVLAQGLGVDFREVNITKAVERHFEDIGQSKDDLDVTFENSQARERTQVLMDIANKLGGMVVGTGDLSELALGWATYNGDHMSMYGVNASIPKTLVRYLVKYYADTCDSEDVKNSLYDILDTPVSPELLPADGEEISQQTESIVGPYELHDFFLYYIVRWGYSPKKVYRIALKTFDGKYDKTVIIKWLKSFYKRFFAQQFKRSCLPDGPKVGSVTLSPRGDWRMPSDASTNLWLSELEDLDK
ncbi:MAG: NAD(+) synthase [Clostridia bacterium]|nr:NAD(+) synthase [Clostridia bacterium]MDE7329231.1 NAD(+) synthase [Clostridia bacterium]